MFDPISLLAGAGILAGGYGAGRVGRARRLPKPVPPVPSPKPVCTCGHGLHDHDRDAEACHAKVKSYRWNGAYGREVLDKYVPCTCKQYQGPRPLPEFFAPEIAG